MAAYKKDQGRIARLVAFWLVAAWIVFGASALHATFMTFEVFEGLRAPLTGSIPVLGWTVNVALLLALVVAIGGVSALVVFQDKPKPADLLIDTEAELRKVTWPTMPEVVNTSIVVVISVLFLMAFLAAADWVLFRLMQNYLLGG